MKGATTESEILNRLANIKSDLKGGIKFPPKG